MSHPLLTVILPVYNAEKFVDKAIKSILGQTFKDFEFIIINDGSVDNTGKIISSYSDKRIVLVEQTNKGLVASLNLGIQMASGEYIARQDADDISESARLKDQMNFMQHRPEVVLLGTSMKVIDDNGRMLHTHHVLLNDAELRQELLVRSPFAHGSVVFRKDAVVKAGLYRQKYWPAEDYDLWLRLSAHGKLANINEALYTYREGKGGISVHNKELQLAKTNEVQQAAWSIKNVLLKEPIKLANYKGLKDGNIRIDRILSNVSYIYKRAIRDKKYRFALKVISLVAGNPTAYRKLAGRAKRKIKKL